MKVCSNTSPIIFLSKINQLELLNKCFSEIFVPEAVLNELIDENIPAFISQSKLSEHGKAFVAGSVGSLHHGELEAIILARELQADFVLLDDSLARKKAQRMGLKIIGTLGVLLQPFQGDFLTNFNFSVFLQPVISQ